MITNKDVTREVGTSVSKAFVEGIEDALQNYNKGDGGVAKGSDVDAQLDLVPVELVANEWDIDINSVRTINALLTSEDANAKTITISNVPTTSLITVGIELVATTAPSGITYPANTTFIDGEPTIADGETWWIGLSSKDNGATWRGICRQIA